MVHSILPWLCLIAVIWLQSFNGSNTDFPAYSSQLKQLLSISQLQLNNLAFASDAGKLFGWLSGVAAVYLPLWMVLIIGGTLGFIGYGFQFLFVAKKISCLSYWIFFILNILAGNSICWINTVCYMTIIRHFSLQYSQVAVGLATSYLGLSARVYTDIVDAIPSTSSSSSSTDANTSGAKSYLLLNSILPLMVSLITAPLFRDIKKTKNRTEEIKQEGFTVMFVITIVTGIYSVVGSLGLKKIVFSPLFYVIGFGWLLFVMPLMVPVRDGNAREILLQWWVKIREKKVCDISNSMETVDDDKRVAIEVKEEDTTTTSTSNEIAITRVREEIRVEVMVRRVEFWLYFFVYMFGATLGLVFMNNLGQIAESRGQSAAASSLVALSSSFGFFGRLMPSLLHHFFPKTKEMVSTTASMLALMVPIAGAFFLLVNTSTISLYISTAIIGVCCGAFTTLTVPASTELFGVKNFSVNHNIVVANIPIGSFLFGSLAALLYQRSKGTLENGICMGPGCYRDTFLIWGCIATLGTILAFILYLRTREFYSQRYLDKQEPS